MNFLKNYYFIINLIVISLCKISQAQEYNVRNYGAVGNGKTDDTQAIRKTFAAVDKTIGGRVIFDHGYTFISGGVNVTSSNTIIDVRGKILGSSNLSNYEW